MAAIPTSSIDPDYSAAMPCPYLGLRDDPVTHFAWDNPNHHCHRVDPPQPIRITHQQSYCLSGRFETCPVRNDLNPSPSPSKYRNVFESDNLTFRMRLPRFSLPQFGLDTFWRPTGEGAPEGRRQIMALVVTGVMVPLLLVLIWAIFINSGGTDDNQASASGDPSSLAAAIDITPTPEIPTATHTPLPSHTLTVKPSNTPTATSDAAATQTALAPTPSTTPTPTPLLYGCNDIRAYTFDIVEGPLLSPEPGYVYLPGDTPPVITASWLLENTGSCQWSSILLLSTTSGRLLIPLVFVENELILQDPDSDLALAGPGDQVEVALNFSTDIASSIQGEWVVVVGNFRLEEQPHLELNVVNWIIRVSPTATTRPSTRPEEPEPGDTPPPVRPTPTQPSTRP